MTEPADHDDDRSDHDDAHGDQGDHDPRLQAGLDHLQRAAHEVIAASRALLDVAEELVDDPRAAGSLADLFASFSGFAGRLGRMPGAGPVVDATGADDDDDDPPVQRIPVS